MSWNSLDHFLEVVFGVDWLGNCPDKVVFVYLGDHGIGLFFFFSTRRTIMIFNCRVLLTPLFSSMRSLHKDRGVQKPESPP